MCQVELRDSSNMDVSEVRVNASQTSVLLRNLTQGSVYSATVKAFTAAGTGPSAHTSVRHNPTSYQVVPAPRLWLVLLVAATAVVLVTAFAATFYLRRKQAMTKQLGHMSGMNSFVRIK